MTDLHYTKKAVSSAPQRKKLTKERKIQLGVTLMRIKNIEEAEIADLLGMSRNNLRTHYNKTFQVLKEESK